MVLITGGSGYLGGRISNYIQHYGYKVRIGRNPESESEGFPVNLNNEYSLKEACDGVSTIIHLASMNAISSSNNLEKARLVNELGTSNLLKVASKNRVKKFLYFSTTHVYGSPLRGIINEESELKPNHPYSITKYGAENSIVNFQSQKKINKTIFRLSNAVGSPINPNTNCWMLIANDLCRQVVTNQSMNINSNKLLKRDFIPISSVCNVVLSWLKSDQMNGEIVNVSSGFTMTLESLANLIANRSNEVLGFKPNIFFADNPVKKKNHHFKISNNKIVKMGFEIDNNLAPEIDNLLLNCQKWFI